MAERPRILTFDELIRQGTLEIGDGYRAKLEELGGNGFPFLRAGLLETTGFNWAKAERFNDDLAHKFASKISHPGDTLVTTKGNSVGRTAYMPAGSPICVYSPHLSYWRPLDPVRLTTRFLYYWSQSTEFVTQLHAMAYSTDMAPYLSLSDQRRLRITLPDISVQQAISSLLSALDDKIAANDRIAEKSDSLIRIQYTNETRAHRNSIQLGHLGILVRDGISAGALNGTENYIALEHMPRRNMWLSSWGNSINVASQKNRFRNGDILFGKLRPYFHKVGVAFIDGISSTDIFVVRPRTDAYRGWLLATLASDDVVAHASAIGDGTRMPRARWRDLADLEVPWVGDQRARAFDELITSLTKRVFAAVTESQSLAKLRDALLPKLMSGEIRVREAERVVGDAT